MENVCKGAVVGGRPIRCLVSVESEASFLPIVLGETRSFLGFLENSHHRKAETFAADAASVTFEGRAQQSHLGGVTRWLQKITADSFLYFHETFFSLTTQEEMLRFMASFETTSSHSR